MEKKFYEYDVIVIGGGLSGCEAAAAAARRGVHTLLISINMDSVAAMQFGNILWIEKYRELFRAQENMGSKVPGIIRKNILARVKSKDPHFKDLEGTSVIDRKRFSLDMKEMLENHDQLETRQALVADISRSGNGYNVETSDNQRYKAGSVVICTGTYLDAKIRWGENILKAGRPGEIRSSRLYENLKKKKVEFEKKKLFSAPKIIIGLKTAGREAARLVSENGSRLYAVSPAGVSADTGVQNIFLVPEGRETKEMYVWGFENNLSEVRQLSRLKRITGLEDVYMTRPGYEIEYNCLSPSMKKEDLQVENFKGLLFAGKVCGSKTYEESLALGTLAGINAGNIIRGKNTVKLSEITGLLYHEEEI